MTHRLDRLESAGLIQRVANPDDRRSLLIRLTEAGRSMLLGCLDDYLAALHQLQAPLDPQQRRLCADALRSVLLPLEVRDDV